MKIKTLQIILIFFVLLACNKHQDEILTIKDISGIDESTIEIEKPVLKDFIVLDGAWEKGIAEGKEKSKPDFYSKPELKELVSLPDKQNLNPYTSIWYQKTITVDKDYILFVSPDDGAQVFLDSVFISPFEPDVYDLSSKTGNEIILTIRCMNQAMHGGLKRVKLIEKSIYYAYKKQTDIYTDLLTIKTKLQLIPGLEQELTEIANIALESKNENTIEIALNQLSKYPINLVDPFLQKTDSTTHILWESDVNTTANFLWGYDSAMLNNLIAVDPDSLNMFRISENFEEEKTVYYQIKYGRTQTRIYNFPTRNSNDPLSFFLWADSQGGWEAFRKLSDIMLSYPASFSVGVGDLVNNGKKEEEYRKLHRSHHSVSSKIPVYLVPGNHDYDGYYNSFVAENFHRYSYNKSGKLKGNYFSFSEGNAMFIALDPNENFPLGIPGNSEQYTWFFNQLESDEWKNADWHFILVHQPPYSQGWPGYHGAPPVIELLEPLYEKYQIDAVIAGHTHDYERLNKKLGEQNVQFLICGTAGGGIEPLNEKSEWPVMDTIIKEHLFVYVELEKNKASFKAINTENEIVDSFEILK